MNAFQVEHKTPNGIYIGSEQKAVCECVRAYELYNYTRLVDGSISDRSSDAAMHSNTAYSYAHLSHFIAERVFAVINGREMPE